MALGTAGHCVLRHSGEEQIVFAGCAGRGSHAIGSDRELDQGPLFPFVMVFSSS